MRSEGWAHARRSPAAVLTQSTLRDLYHGAGVLVDRAPTSLAPQAHGVVACRNHELLRVQNHDRLPTPPRLSCACLPPAQMSSPRPRGERARCRRSRWPAARRRSRPGLTRFGCGRPVTSATAHEHAGQRVGLEVPHPHRHVRAVASQDRQAGDCALRAHATANGITASGCSKIQSFKVAAASPAVRLCLSQYIEGGNSMHKPPPAVLSHNVIQTLD